MRRWCLVLALSLGCSGGGDRARGSQEPAAPAGAPGPAASQPRAEGAALTEAECHRFIDHMLELTMAEKRATLPADEVPTEEQVAKIRAEMHADAGRCVGQPRGPFDCAMRATTAAGVRTCFAEGS